MGELEFQVYVLVKIVMENFPRSLVDSNTQRESFIRGWLSPHITGLVV